MIWYPCACGAEHTTPECPFSIESFRKPGASIFDRINRKAEAAKAKREAYAEVDARDKRTCRCCGRIGNPNATTALGRIHRAHIVDASRGGQMVASNLCSLCWICHALEHSSHQIAFVGIDANDMGLGFEIAEAAVVHVFGTDPLPPHVHIVTEARR
jgi:hypothetical protein